MQPGHPPTHSAQPLQVWHSEHPEPLADTSSLDELLQRGYSALDKQVYCEAQRLFGLIIQSAPDNPAGYLGRGLTWLSQHAAPQAEADFRTALHHDPACATAHYQLALLLYSQEQHAEAAAQLEYAVMVCPDDSDLWMLLGMVRELLDPPHQAIEAYTHAIAIERLQDATTYFLRGLAYLEMRNPAALAQALADLRQAELYGYPAGQIAFYCGIAHYYQHQYHDAIHAFSQALAKGYCERELFQYLLLAQRAIRQWQSQQRRTTSMCGQRTTRAA